MLGRLFLIISVILAVFVGLKLKELATDGPVPVLPRDVWWGPGIKRPVDDAVKPFRIEVSDQALTDLKARLSAFLLKPSVPPLEGIGFEYGFNTDYLRTVIKYWRDQYDWRIREKYLNSFPQYTTVVNGLKIHYLRVKPSTAAAGKRVLPILLLHGWPGSVREFYELIPLLTKPSDSADFVFEVIAPSLPGYGWSEAAAKPGLGPAEVAVVMHNLMTKIGFNRYYTQGGDWGAMITKVMGMLYPESVLGVHSNMCGVNNGLSNLYTAIGSVYPSFVVDEKHQKLMYPWSQKFFTLLEESGYFHIQATKPDTIGTVLTDTPAGLAAYILEKFSTWTNNSFKSLPDGGLTKKFTLDNLLDNIMIYWVTNSITTSQRLYSEAFTFKQMAHGIDKAPLTVPSSCVRLPNELLWQPDRILALQYKNLVQVTDFDDGGHFAAFELPHKMAKDIFSGIGKMEKLRNEKKKK